MLMEANNTISRVIHMLIKICSHVKNLAQSELRLRFQYMCVCVSVTFARIQIGKLEQKCVQKAFQLVICE